MHATLRKKPQKYTSLLHFSLTLFCAHQVDIATVDIIERASRADPDGKRTIGVLTKPDMIGEGAHAPVIETLLNVSKPLKLGYVMVKASSIMFCM